MFSLASQLKKNVEENDTSYAKHTVSVHLMVFEMIKQKCVNVHFITCFQTHMIMHLIL